jgi:hypothetical protein
MTSDLLERDIETPAMEFAMQHGWFQEKIVRAGRRGFPDRFVAREGEILLLEFKRPNGEARVQQAKRHRELRAAGVKVIVVDTLAQAKRILR